MLCFYFYLYNLLSLGVWDSQDLSMTCQEDPGIESNKTICTKITKCKGGFHANGSDKCNKSMNDASLQIMDFHSDSFIDLLQVCF